MLLTRQAFDVGLYTDNGEEVLAFWQKEVGFDLASSVPVDKVTMQHRHRAGGCAFKINVLSRGELPRSPSSGGFRELWVPRPKLTSDKRLTDPDGNEVRLVPPDALGEARIGMRVQTGSAAKLGQFYQEAMGFRRVDDRTYSTGQARLVIEESSGPCDAGKLRLPGYRYLTFHVDDVDKEYEHVIGSGGQSGMAPMQFANVARIAFVKDDAGSWYELARAL